MDPAAGLPDVPGVWRHLLSPPCHHCVRQCELQGLGNAIHLRNLSLQLWPEDPWQRAQLVSLRGWRGVLPRQAVAAVASYRGSCWASEAHPASRGGGGSAYLWGKWRGFHRRNSEIAELRHSQVVLENEANQAFGQTGQQVAKGRHINSSGGYCL